MLSTDDLLDFCTYYTLLKINNNFTSISFPPVQNKVQQKIVDHQVRQKHQINSKKIKQKPVRSKFQQVKPKNKRSVSPINTSKQQVKQTKRQNKINLDYFLSQISTQNNGKSNQINYDNFNKTSYLFQNKNSKTPTKIQNYTQKSNIDVFAQTIQPKYKYQSNIDTYQPERPYYQKKQPLISNFNVQSSNKSVSPWQQRNRYNNYFDTERKNKQKNMYQTPVGYLKQSHLKYSGINLHQSPSQSITTLRLSPQTFSKSPNRHQRKKSQRPLYDTSRLTQNLLQEQLIQQQKPYKLTTSYVMNDVNDKRQQISKRQTSSTIIGKLKTQKQSKVDLDDQLQYQLQIQQRRKRPPTPINISLR